MRLLHFKRTENDLVFVARDQKEFLVRSFNRIDLVLCQKCEKLIDRKDLRLQQFPKQQALCITDNKIYTTLVDEMFES